MAKKRRRAPKEEEKYEFVPPEFDEREFLLKDIQVTKILWVVTALAVVMGLVAHFFVEMAGEMAVGFLVLMVSLLGLKQLLMLLRFDLSEVEGKSMIGNYVLFFFLFLGVWIICMNPPVSDHTSPVIGDVNVQLQVGGEWVDAGLASGTFSMSGNGMLSVSITAKVVDNTPLEVVTIYWTPHGGSEHSEAMESLGDDVYRFVVEVAAPGSGGTINTNSFYLSVSDAAGNLTETQHYNVRVSYSA